MTVTAPSASVIWHDLECGAYTADLALWRELADRHGDPVLDVGAGTGRVSLELARGGHLVVALDQDPVFLAELARRAAGLPVEVVQADARFFTLTQRFALIVVPMQTIQLLGGPAGRAKFLGLARRHLGPGGVVALAITERLEHYSAQDALPLPLPDMRELGGVVYSSQPTAVRESPGGFVLERLRERIGPRGERQTEDDVIQLDRLTAPELAAEGEELGLHLRETRQVPETADHVGSAVVILGG